jgi:hypothetical protein
VFAWGELGGDAASPTRGRTTALEAAPRAKTSTMRPNLMQLMLRGLAGTSIEEVCFRPTAGVRLSTGQGGSMTELPPTP